MTYTNGALPSGFDQNPGLAGGQPSGRRQPQGQHDAVRRLLRHQDSRSPSPVESCRTCSSSSPTRASRWCRSSSTPRSPTSRRYLSGDAVKDYPNLAAIPTRAWKTTIFDAKIYGVPVPLRPYFWWYWVHQELLDQAGLKQPTNADEMKQHLTQFTQPNSGVWGHGRRSRSDLRLRAVDGPVHVDLRRAQQLGRRSSQRQIHRDVRNRPVQSKPPQYVKDLYTAGVFHPDSSNYNTISARDAFQARKFAYRYDGLEVYGWRKPPVQLSPPPNVQLVKPFGATGGPGTYWYRPAEFRLRRHAQDAVARSHQDAAARPELSRRAVRH